MNNTNYDRIKNMSLDEMTKFFTDLVHTDIITTADHYICQKCKAEHNGECPIGDDDNCLYDSSDYITVKLWLTGDTDRAERTKTIVDELRAKPSRDNRSLLDRAADRIEELEALLGKERLVYPKSLPSDVVREIETRARTGINSIKAEVAREIFEEIEFEIHQLDFDREETRAIAIEGIIAELKKKYTEDHSDGGY